MSASKSNFTNTIIDILEMLFIGAVVFFLVWLFLGELVEVTGDSMTPTLHNKEQVLVEKVTLNFGEIQRGDIIVFESPENRNRYLIKRVIALPNETFEIKEGSVLIDGKRLPEPYITGTVTEGRTTIPNDTPVELGSDTYVFLGDNRKNSSDSREFGPVSKDRILGKAVLVYYPLGNLRIIDHVDFLLTSRVVDELNYSGNL